VRTGVASRLMHAPLIQMPAMVVIPTDRPSGRDLTEVALFPVCPTPSQTKRRRHHRRYAEGELGPDRSFYFCGPENKLNLRAQNFILFQQLAEGVNDATWLHYLRHTDYSRWF
jgi:hypothetical protein